MDAHKYYVISKAAHLASLSESLYGILSNHIWQTEFNDLVYDFCRSDKHEEKEEINNVLTDLLLADSRKLIVRFLIALSYIYWSVIQTYLYNKYTYIHT